MGKEAAAEQSNQNRETWVFDLDGTLVDSFSHYFIALNELFVEHGVVFRDEHRLEALTLPLPEFFRDNLGSAAVPAAFARLQTRSNEDARLIRPFEGVPELLAGLTDRGARVAVWTNRDLTSAELILEHSGLGRHVEYCVSGTCVERKKPHPEGLSRILARFSCPVSSVTMVGDHEHDILAAKAGGARAIRASWHTYWETENCHRADFQFRSIPQFAEWLGK